MESRKKITMILRCGGCFYKVLKLRTTKDNNCTFECKDLNTKEEKKAGTSQTSKKLSDH